MIDTPYSRPDELAPLLQACPQAPFGKGKQTMYNTQVRDAKQLKFEDGSFSVSNFDPESILSTI